MKKYSLAFLLLFNTIALYGQNKYSVAGHVFDQLSNKPLENVNVFIPNTLIGTTTDKNGYFKLNSLPTETPEIVLSIIGYEIIAQKFSLYESSSRNLEFRLKPKDYELPSIEITSSHPVDWDKNLEKFKERFLGTSPFAQECRMENTEYINFKWSSSTVLTASSEKPLIIYNDALGYKIECSLISFSWDIINRKLNYLVKPRFSEMKPASSKKLEHWTQNRKIAYAGSLHHFLTALIQNTLQQEGFSVYYDNAPRQQRGEKIWNLIQRDSVLKATGLNGDYEFKFNKYLRIVYNNNISWIKLLYPWVTIDTFAYIKEEQSIELHGNWSLGGVANMLPQYVSTFNQ